MRSLNLDQLRTFVEVAKQGSFTAAAKALNLSQPAVTHQVNELESRLKITLLELIGNAGELLQVERRTLENMRRFDDGWLGRVRIGTSMTVLMYALPPILHELKIKHSQLELVLKTGLTANTLQMLKTNELDLGLCALPVTDPAFETTPLFDDELFAILPVDQKNVPKKVTPAFLAGCPLILGNERAALRRTVTDWLALAGPPPK